MKRSETGKRELRKLINKAHEFNDYFDGASTQLAEMFNKFGEFMDYYRLLTKKINEGVIPEACILEHDKLLNYTEIPFNIYTVALPFEDLVEYLDGITSIMVQCEHENNF